jgi:energy-coupling factor transporter ATP-binding protein EcfA2
MGRSKFAELYEQTQRDSFRRGFESIYLYGSSGSGKSHILAALACQLIREGKRVVYLPDCGQLLKNFPRDLRLALRCAFYGSRHLETIDSACDLEPLLKFCEKRTDIYYIVDQLNALELGGLHGSSDDEKKEVTTKLKRITSGHMYIFSASANEKSNQIADSKQSGISVLRMDGGMNRVSRSLNTAPYNAYVLLDGNGPVVSSLCRQNSAIIG